MASFNSRSSLQGEAGDFLRIPLLANRKAMAKRHTDLAADFLPSQAKAYGQMDKLDNGAVNFLKLGFCFYQ